MWLVDMFPHCLRIPYAILHAGLSVAEHSDLVDEFNSKESPMEVLVFNFKTSSTGLNLHPKLASMVILEMAPNGNTLLQTIGRMNRLGQTEEQHIWIMSLLHSFNRSEEYAVCNKMSAEVVANYAATINPYIEARTKEAI
ncbi:hypothetical protein FQN50_009477 [Emmonsiellopsis sp. PD_5]|nr:hypothetical protein FQN50_009477 [Emmonsiellopsis sp. PD_5]